MADNSLSDAKLATIVGQQIADARLYYDSNRSGFRDKAIDYFEGDEKLGGDVPPLPNRSKVVSRDVSDVHGMIMPSLLRVFFSSDRVAIYEPTRKENEQFAAQATDLVNYIVLKECAGYRYFRDAMSDGLLLGNGILKHWWDDTPEYKTESFTGLTDAAYKLLMQDPDIEEVLEQREYPDPSWVPPTPQPAPPMGMPGAMPPTSPGGMGPPPGGPENTPQPDMQAGMLYDCKVKRVVSSGRLRVTSIPYEEFLIEQTARELDEENCRFCAHARMRTRSSLIEEGYDPAVVETLPAFSDTSTQQTREKRDEMMFVRDEGPDRSTDLIEVYECFVQVDANGDGVSEWMRVIMAGSLGNRAILHKEEWGDDLPFTDIVPDPRPYAWRGVGLFDLLADIQKVKTVLLRSVLDNTYMVTNPITEVVEGNLISSLDSVINPQFGEAIRVKQPGTVTPLVQPYIVDKISPVIDYMDSVTERRTGISRQTQALDLDVLQNQSATAVNAAQSAAFTKIEEYARNIAECGGLKRAFKCILKLIVKHQDRPKAIKLRGEWVEMDPSAWDADMGVTINTGLGAGSRERDLAALSNILAKQEQAIQMGGPNNPLAPLDKYQATLYKLCEISGIKSPEQFFSDITPDVMQQIAQQPPPPDPKMIAAQSKAQSDQMHMQLQQQQMQADQAKEQARTQIEQMKAQTEFAIQQSEAQGNQARIMAEIEKARAEAQAKIIEANARVKESQLQQQLDAARLQLDRMKAEAGNQTTLAKTAIDNLVRLEIARINASKDTDQRPDAVEQRLSADAGVPWHQANNVQTPPPPQFGQ